MLKKFSNLVLNPRKFEKIRASAVSDTALRQKIFRKKLNKQFLLLSTVLGFDSASSQSLQLCLICFGAVSDSIDIGLELAPTA
jgi:hypothetical protein